MKDQGDGTYTVTYVVPKRGNYMVHVKCNGKPVMGSPFPFFFLVQVVFVFLLSAFMLLELEIQQ